MIFRKLLVLMISVLLLISCSETDSSKVEPAKDIASVSVYDGVSLRDEPIQDGTWLSSISLGETVTWLGKSVTDSTEKKTYINVKLSDGKEGWASAYTIVKDAYPAAVFEEITIYKRPDLLTMTDKSLSPFDIIAIKNTQPAQSQAGNEWLEIVGTRRKQSGWIKKESISSNSIDIAAASLIRKALEEKTDEAKVEKLQALLENEALRKTIFLPKINQLITELSPKTENIEELSPDASSAEKEPVDNL